MEQPGMSRSWRPLRLSIAVTLVLLSLQAWTGDFVNIFITTSASTGVQQSLQGFFAAIFGEGPFLIWHALEGILIFLSAVGVLVVSLLYSRRSVKVGALLALFFVVVAGLGGYLFVLSGFTDGGSSMQMGGSFLGAYAFYFITLWYTK